MSIHTNTTQLERLAVSALEDVVEEYVSAKREYQLCQQALREKDAMLKQALDKLYEDIKGRP